MHALIFIYLFSFLVSAFAGSQTKDVCIKKICVQAEVADSDETRDKGLMFRKSLGDNQGMLFIFDREDRHNFWMKNILFALDIIWIDKHKKVIDIKKNTPPCQGPCPSLIPLKTARYVLEVNSGFIEKHKIKVGDRVSF